MLKSVAYYRAPSLVQQDRRLQATIALDQTLIPIEGLCVQNACGAVNKYTKKEGEGSVANTQYVGGLSTMSDS